MTVQEFETPLRVSESPVCDHPEPAVTGVDALETHVVVTYNRFGMRPKAVSFNNPERPGFHLSCGCVVTDPSLMLVRNDGEAWFEANR